MPERLTELPYPLPGTIYRSALPFSWLFDPGGRLFDSFQTVGVETVVMLTPVHETIELTNRNMRTFYEDHGLQVLYQPVDDFSVPSGTQFRQTVSEALALAEDGQTLVIHCHAGIGRTGMFAACLAKRVFDFDGQSAVAWVRQYIPDAVENRRQYQYVSNF